MRGGDVEVELLKYADLSEWKPKIGDMVFHDGFIFRWFAIIYQVNNDMLSVKKSGNLRLLMQGEYEETILNFRKIKNSMVGSFSVIGHNNVYYV
jgi:hypothetical protein